MHMKSHYQVLDVPRSASQQEIKKAYRRLAMKWHPDRNLDDVGNAETIFKHVKAAFETLSDESRRRYYDEMYGMEGGSGRSSDHQEVATSPMDGKDAHGRCSLGLDMALAGVTVDVAYETLDLCSECCGDGYVTPGYGCSNCGATGKKSYADGLIRCRKCSGTGKAPQSKCSTCRGKGFVAAKRSLRVQLPQGVYDGCTFTIQGKGGKGLYGGRSGALVLTVSLKNSDKLRVAYPDVIVPLKVDFVTAMLGGTVLARMRFGDFDVVIPELSRAGRLLHIEGAGLRKKDSIGRGRLIFEIVIDLPRRLIRITDDVRSKLEAL